MNTATTLLHDLHDLRGQQLKALDQVQMHLPYEDLMQVIRYVELCGIRYDTRNLSDKSLEEIDTLSGKYLDRVR